VSHIERIGNPRGRIALYLDEVEAIDMAYKYGLDDEGAKELLAAVERAYPETDELDERLGLRIVVCLDPEQQ
jgi:hypothetical protein